MKACHYWLLAGAMLLLSPSAGAAELLPRVDWPVVRSGTTVARIPTLQRVMRQFEQLEDGVIVVRYPGGDQGNAWAVELRGWLVALGVSARQIRLEPGSGIPDTIVIHATEQRR